MDFNVANSVRRKNKVFVLKIRYMVICNGQLPPVTGKPYINSVEPILLLLLLSSIFQTD